MIEEKRTRFTYNDLLSLGETNIRIELIDGRIVVSPPPDTQRERVGLLLSLQIESYVDKQEVIVFSNFAKAGETSMAFSNPKAMTSLLFPDAEFNLKVVFSEQ